MDVAHTDRVMPWNAPTLNGWKRGRRLAIVSTGPSYDLLKKEDLAGFDLFAINAAITEVHPLAAKQDVYWVCHDLWKIWKHGFRARIKGYEAWKVITRRVYLPGRAGDVPWTNPDHSRNTSKFPWRMPSSDIQRSIVYWYTELADQEGYALSQETTLEVALEVAAFWGYEQIVLIGVDMGPVDGRAYANPWKWKHCHIRPGKFERMRQMLLKNRGRWPKDIFTTSPNWEGSFIRVASPAEVPQPTGVQNEAQGNVGSAVRSSL